MTTPTKAKAKLIPAIGQCQRQIGLSQVGIPIRCLNLAVAYGVCPDGKKSKALCLHHLEEWMDEVEQRLAMENEQK